MWWICQKIPTAAIVVVVGLRIVVVSYRRSHGPHYCAQCHSESDVAAQFPHARALKLLESLLHFSEGFTLATLATWFINSGLGISLSTLDVLIQISLRTQVMVEDWYWPHVSQRSGQCHPRRTVCGPQHGWFIWAVNRSYQISNTVFFDIQYVYMNILNTCTDVQFRLHVFFKWCAFIGFTDRRADNWQQNYPVLAVPPLKWLGWLKCYFSFLNVITSSRMHIFFMCVCMYPWCGVPQVTDSLRSTKLTERISIEIHWAPQFTVVSVVFSGRCFDSIPFCCWANSVGHASTGLGTWIDLNQLWKRWAKLLDGPASREWGNGIIDAYDGESFHHSKGQPDCQLWFSIFFGKVDWMSQGLKLLRSMIRQ